MADNVERDDISPDIEESDNDLDEGFDVDNDEGLDLDGDQDEDIDTALDDDSDEDIEEVDEDDELDESDETDEETDEDDGDDDTDSDTDDAPAQPDEKDAIIEDLKRQLATERGNVANLKHLSKETLEKMGITVEGDVADTMERTVAESEGVSVEEYRKRRQDSLNLEQEKETAKRQAFETLAANDLSELKKSFPDLLGKGRINDCFDSFDDFVEFGRLRDAGISPKKAYLAVNGDKVRNQQAIAAQRKATSDGKKHLTSVAPKKASDDNIVMPKETLREWRDLFPGKSDKEIRALYKQSL